MNYKVMGFALLSASFISACSFPSGYRSMNQLTYGEPVRKVAAVKASTSTPYRYATVPTSAYRLASKPTYAPTQAGPVIADPTRAASPSNPVILGSNSRPNQIPTVARASNQVVYQASRPNTPTVVTSTAPTPYAAVQPVYAQPVVTLKLPAPIN
jgi:hypothetical protein